VAVVAAYAFALPFPLLFRLDWWMLSLDWHKFRTRHNVAPCTDDEEVGGTPTPPLLPLPIYGTLQRQHGGVVPLLLVEAAAAAGPQVADGGGDDGTRNWDGEEAVAASMAAASVVHLLLLPRLLMMQQWAMQRLPSSIHFPMFSRTQQ
jgi:hypothetical protein